MKVWDVQGLKVDRSMQVCNGLRDQYRLTGPMSRCRFLLPACRIEACGWDHCLVLRTLTNFPSANQPHSVAPLLVVQFHLGAGKYLKWSRVAVKKGTDNGGAWPPSSLRHGIRVPLGPGGPWQWHTLRSREGKSLHGAGAG